ncbi:MAG: aspartate dehydrogenase domain-containing protein [Candidatus Omnitrophota bacterium]
MLKRTKLKIGIVGCGAIGSSLAEEIAGKFKEQALLCGLFDIKPEKAIILAKKIRKNNSLAVATLDELIRKSDLLIEASHANSAWQIARKTVSSGRKIMIMSVGGMVGHLDELFRLSSKHNTQVYFPSGAISGIDALKAANIAGIKKVTLTTRKHPNSFSGVDYVTKKFKLPSIKKDTILFKGSARLATKYFPQNINVAAVLALAGIGIDKTKVQIIASPKVNRNIHEILIESKSARIFTRTENVLHPQNPKTSFLAVLSAIATLRQILQPVKIGT